VTIISTPGLFTVTAQDYTRCAQLRRHGYAWVAFQAQNDDSLVDHDLNPAKGAGLETAVWGVSYSPDNFGRDGYLLAKQALKLGASHLIMDVEQAAKNTSPGGLKVLVDECRAAGWSYPVHLSTMGPPSSPDVNDYGMDVASFLDTGGGVLTQAYANETDLFTPELAVRYWTRVGVPRDRLNLTISLYPAEADKQYPGRRYDGQKWVQLLQAAGWGKAISIFMAEAATDTDLDALDAITVEAVLPSVNDAANRRAALAYLKQSVDYYRSSGKLTEAGIAINRQALAWRVLNTSQTGVNMRALRDLLDGAGAPKP
jgi:hypothetical protein